MERGSDKAVQGKIYADPELRRLAYETIRRQRQAARAARDAEVERQQGRDERLKAFWERLGYTPDRAADEREREQKRLLAMPAAEAWMETHPIEINAETCPDIVALARVVREERRRLKAVRRIFKELGIR